MAALSPPACLWCALLSVAVSLDLRVAYVTHSGLYYYSCLHEPPPCSQATLSDCSCEDLQLSSPALQVTRLTVWYTSAASTARLLNNSVVRNLTLIRCGAGGPRGAAPQDTLSQDRYFAVQQLEWLSVVNLQRKPILEEARNTGPEIENGADLSTFVNNRVTDTHQDLNTEAKKEFFDLLPPQSQDLFLGREMGAPFYEQVRLGVIYSSVLDSGAELKAYTVQTHIGSDGLLPFPELHLPHLEETSTIYVSFVY
ncbi:uncharacterized protein si:ch73-52p7.1 isoform X2 [Boleophthalmus pectinirostris]|nr:uncharacterized protein si:ch73-52p7.1 isoform X2 [Boleophthalmus pectinirostris]